MTEEGYKEISVLIGKPVYTQRGTYLGRVVHVVITLYDISKLIVSWENKKAVPPSINKEGKPIGIPYEWVAGVDDAVILKYFPKFSYRKTSKESPKEPEEAEVQVRFHIF